MKLEKLSDAIILIALVTFIGAAGAIALNEFGDDQITSNVVTNESEASFTNASTPNCGLPVEDSLTAYVNVSGTTYAYVDYGITMTEAGDITLNNDNMSGNVSLLTYSCYQYDNAYNVTVYGLDGEQNATGYLDTIGTIIGIAVLVTIVIGAFAMMNRM
jgi:hypothetical protein